MKKIFFIFLIFAAKAIIAQHTKDVADTSFPNCTVNGSPVVAGETISFAVGAHISHTQFNDCHGASRINPIFIDLNGQTIDGENADIILELQNCSYINISNGFLINSSTQGMNTSTSWGIEIDNIDISNTTSTALLGGYQGVASDSSKWRSSFMDPYLVVTNCVTDSEGISVSSVNWDSWFQQSDTVWQHPLLAYALIANNTIHDTPYDGIQIGSCLDADIYGNEVYNYGQIDDANYNNGIHLASGVTGKIYNNYIHRTGATDGYGIYNASNGADIYNNVLDSVFNGINMTSILTSANSSTKLMHNTLSRVVGNYGINVAGEYFNSMFIFNNIVHFTTVPDDATTFYVRTVSTPTNYEISNNYLNYEGAVPTTDIFNDPGNADFYLKALSPAINYGHGKARFFISGLRKDFVGERRPGKGSVDAGAYTY
jgi:hypothetical protein